MPAVSLAGAAGVLAVTQGSPIWAAIFVWELAHPPLWLFLVFLVTALRRIRIEGACAGSPVERIRG